MILALTILGLSLFSLELQADACHPGGGAGVPRGAGRD
jgi:hypothetical protein